MEDCHYISGIQYTIKIIRSTQKVLEKLGVQLQRLQLEYCSASEEAKYAEVINRFTAAIDTLGPLVLDGKQKQKLLELKERKTKMKKTKKGVSVKGCKSQMKSV